MPFIAMLRNLLHRERADRDLDAELRAHLDLLTEEKLHDGLSPADARRAARLELGGIEQVKEEVRGIRPGAWLDSFWQDLRFAARQVRRNPGFAALAILTLALGIGANTAMFSLINGVLLRPLPVPSPEQVVVLAVEANGSPLGAVGLSFPQFRELRDQAKSFCDVFGLALAGPDVSLAAGDRAEPIALAAVSGNYFPGLRLTPAAGRFFHPGEGEKPGEDALLVLGHSFWMRRFGGDPSVIGTRVRVGGIPVTIIGVAPAGFGGSFSIFDIDGYMNFSAITRDERWSRFWTDRNFRMILAMARVREGVSISRAQAGIGVITGHLEKEYSATDRGVRISVIPERLARPIPYANKNLLVISALFLALAALVLLLACTNVTNILMARVSIRQREMAVRAALGAGRARLLRQLLVETLLLAVLGGAAGLLVATWANRALGSIHFSSIPLRLDCRLDWRVFAFALAAVLFSSIFAGIWPAWHATRRQVSDALHGSGPGGDSASARRRVRSDLMAAQVAGSLALLIVAGLFARSLRAAESAYLGFNPAHVLNVSLDPHQINDDQSQTEAFYRDLEARVAAWPRVQSVSLASFVPIESVPSRHAIYIEGRPVPIGEPPLTILYNRVDAGYFKTLQVPILRGRAFAPTDDAFSPAVAIVNQTMAARFWPHEDPIGKLFSLAGDSGPFLEVVGVMQDGKYSTIGEDPQSYFAVPLLQNYVSARILQIRSSRSSGELSIEVRREIQALAPGMPILEVQTMQEAVAGAKGLFVYRLGASLAAALGVLGLLLATVGVYGIVSYATAQRTREIGIRVALGASSRDISSLVLGRAVQFILAGVLAGLAGAWAVTRVMGHNLLGVSSTDPLTYSACTALIVAVALLACWIPLRRALHVSPLVALRHE